MPLAALLGARLGPRVGSERARAAAGAILVAGGLGGLALLPKAEVVLTVPPQLLVGVGLALVLSALTETALAGRAPQAIHGGWTISARHAGVVVGLAILTPIFTADLRHAETPAKEAIASLVLDAQLPASAKLDLAGRLGDRLNAESGGCRRRRRPPPRRSRSLSTISSSAPRPARSAPRSSSPPGWRCSRWCPHLP
jgi:hypothetical protein